MRPVLRRWTSVAAAALVVAFTAPPAYAGTWHNTTFGTSGSVTLDIAVDAAAPALHVTVALGGNVFGAAAPPPETLTVPLDGAHPKGPVTVTSPFFGPITATMQDDGSIVVDAPSVPGGVIAKMHQTLTKTATGFTGNYTLAFAGSTNTASGTIDVTRS